MKSLFLSLTTFAFCALAPLTRAQQSPPAPPLVTTSGSAEIRVVPDLMDLSFEVEVRSADLAAARKQQAERATKVLAALRAGGIAENDLQSSPSEISANYTNQREETEKVKFYSVSQTVSCTLHDLKKISDVTAQAITAGATGVRNTTLRTSELRKYRDEARIKAIRAAKEKAIALANELGAKVGRPYSITEGSGYQWNTSNSGNNIQVAAAAAGDEAAPSFAPGAISISATINVAFILE
ncbi:MAG: uncharacterized protein QOE70_2601 [Chthoniobacter sp.]|jgi:uncharacterized protein YggE|nr:uncharacterized protein [Chthoniobacter sp.]